MRESPSIFLYFCRTLAVYRLALADILRALAPALVLTPVAALLIGDTTSTLWRLCVYSLLGIALSIGALQLHRLVGLGRDQSLGWIATGQQRRRTRIYLVSVLIVIGIATVCTVPVALVTASDARQPVTQWHASTVFYGLLFLWSFLFTRFSLVFVALALDEPLDLRLSWRVTSHFPKLVIYLSLILPILVFIDATVVEPLLATTSCRGVCAGVFNKLMFAACLSLQAISLTLAYEFMRENSPFFRSDNASG